MLILRFLFKNLHYGLHTVLAHLVAPVRLVLQIGLAELRVSVLLGQL